MEKLTVTVLALVLALGIVSAGPTRSGDMSWVGYSSLSLFRSTPVVGGRLQAPPGARVSLA